MRTFFSAFPLIRFQSQGVDFDHLYNRLLPGGLIISTLLLGVGLAYILVYFSPLWAVLAVLAIPVGIVLVTRPQLGLLSVVFAISFDDLSDFGPGTSFLKLLSLAVFGGAAIHFLIFRRKESLVNVPQNWLILFFIMAAILSNFVALDTSRTLDGTARLIRVLSLYLITINLIQTQQHFKYLLRVFLLSGFVSAVWGLLDPAQAGERFYGTMGQPNDFAVAMVPRLPLALCLLRVEKNLLGRGVLLVMLGTIAYTLILSGSRGGLIAAVVALLLFVLTQKNKIFWFSLVALITIVGFMIMPLHIKQRIGLASAWDQEELGNSTERRETYQVYGLQIWQENPILGVGLDGFAEAYTRSEYRFLQKNATKRVAHNTYLEIIVGTGLIGFIPFISLLALSLYKAWEYKDYLKPYPYIASVSGGLFAAQGGYFLGILFGSRQYEKTLWLLIALVIVVQVLINTKRQHTSSSERPRPFMLTRTSSNGNGPLA